MTLNIFSRLSGKKREQAAQLAAAAQQVLEIPGLPPNSLPYSTYDQMEQDTMVQTALTVKKLGVLAPQFRVEPANDSDGAKRRAEFVDSVFAEMDGSPWSVAYHAMDAFAKGWSVQELVWRQTAGTLILEAIRPKDPSMFGIEVDEFGKLTGLTLQVPGEPVVRLPRDKFVVFQNRARYGRSKGRSDLDAAWRHWVMKTQLISAWKQHLERFAMPTLVGRYQRGVPANEQVALLDALKNLATRNAVTFPNDIEVDTIGGAKEASNGFLDAIEFHNREIARAILGQTLTTDEGRRVGSLALGKVHLQVLLIQLESIRREIADLVMTEQVIRPLIEVNFGPGLVPKFVFESMAPTAFVTGVLDESE